MTFQKLTLKLLYVVALIKYPRVSRSYLYFIRDNYYCRIFQIKYLFSDYIKKKKYKVIEFQGEFDQELRYVLPFAYWHHLNGTLFKTISCKNTKALYFFSENHEERFNERIWEKSYESSEIPNRAHGISLSKIKWARVPLKEHYQNGRFVYDKPILLIANKYNIEWNDAPLNFFDIPTLTKIIERYQERYQIVYNRPLPTQIVSDNSDILDLNEYEWLRNNHPEVLLMEDLYALNKSVVSSFNHLQLMVYANCNHFISVHGGTAALASYFGGMNIILSKRGIEHELNEFSAIFPALSGAKIMHAKNNEEVFEFLEKNY